MTNNHRQSPGRPCRLSEEGLLRSTAYRRDNQFGTAYGLSHDGRRLMVRWSGRLTIVPVRREFLELQSNGEWVSFLEMMRREIENELAT